MRNTQQESNCWASGWIVLRLRWTLKYLFIHVLACTVAALLWETNEGEWFCLFLLLELLEGSCKLTISLAWSVELVMEAILVRLLR